MRLAYLVLLVGAVSAPAAVDDRDFSGTWLFQPERSELSSLPHPPEPKVKIAQDSIGIHGFENNAELWTVRLDGQESRRRDGQTFFNARCKWEGSALLISTNVSEPNDGYTVSDRWKLSRDGQTLTIRRQISRQGRDSESTIVYAREGAPAPVLQTAVHGSRREALLPDAAAQPATPVPYVVNTGTHVPLRLLNSVSTKHSAAGDKVYLQTIYPILSKGRVIIPPGSYVEGSLTEVKPAGRIKGKSEMFLRFDSLTLPNGVTRDFRSRLSGMDDGNHGSLDRKEGKIEGDSAKGQDAKTVATATAAGTAVGAVAGGAAGHLGMGAGIGAAAGALGGLVGVLASRGPDAVLEKGSTVEMVLDRDLSFTPEELVHARMN